MTQSHCTTKRRSFTHLTDIERGQIAAYIEAGLGVREIARKMGRNPSTISREKDLGTVEQIDTRRKPYKKYFPDVGARVYRENRSHCGAHSTILQAWEFTEFAEEKILEQEWSPDVVVGYAKRSGEYDYVPATKTLYNWIDEGKMKVINMDLVLKLRRSTKQRHSRKHKKVLGTSIEERPASVETREEFGHWEIDTVLGHKSRDDALLTLIERKTRNKLITRIPAKTAPAVTDALQNVFVAYPDIRNVFKTITADNGSEFSDLSEQGHELGIDVYFAHPYAAWERGSNERHNGLIRRFIKKGQPIHKYTYTDEQIAGVEKLLAMWPRPHSQQPQKNPIWWFHQRYCI